LQDRARNAGIAGAEAQGTRTHPVQYAEINIIAFGHPSGEAAPAPAAGTASGALCANVEPFKIKTAPLLKDGIRESMKRLLNVLPARAYLQLKWNYGRLFDRKAFEELQKLRYTTQGTFSFKEFDRKKAIFVHIPKCAGIAVKRVLFDDLSGGHTKLTTYCRVFEPELFLSYFKFTFIRNPWDRLVSAYHYLQGGGFAEGDKKWFERELGRYGDFDDFVRNWLRTENIRKHIHFIPQVEFLEDENNSGVKVDYIGFFENIESDFNYIAGRIGVDNTLKKGNASSHNGYWDYYSETTREIVRDVYRRDIERFGYEFDNSSLARQVANRDAALPRIEPG
jgi:hypothetical protein